MRLTHSTPVILLLMTSFFLTIGSAQANNANFVHVRETLFWQELYTEKYHTLYCAIHKGAGEQSLVGHVYPTDWMANAMNCPGTEFCDFARYKDASADLHNLWPMEEQVLDIRRHYAFVEGDKNQGDKKECHFTTYPRGIEPREWAKGEIARSILYMVWKYRLPDFGQVPLMVKWANKYPPNAEEKWRNQKIETVQKNDNPFISNPDFVDEFFASSSKK